MKNLVTPTGRSMGNGQNLTSARMIEKWVGIYSGSLGIGYRELSLKNLKTRHSFLVTDDTDSGYKFSVGQYLHSCPHRLLLAYSLETSQCQKKCGVRVYLNSVLDKQDVKEKERL